MRFNVSSPQPDALTHEGGPAVSITPEQQLRRSLLSCLLWEQEFYEDGTSIAERIADAAAQVPAETVAALAVEARTVHGLRHAPLMLLLDLIRRGGPGVADAIAATIRRPDELGELVSLYWRNGKRPLSKQMKLGLAKALGQFDEYALAKYDRDVPVKLRDVLFLCHAKPADEAQAALFERIASRTLATPDTWEVALSSGADRKATFERLIREGKLGYLALLRNLRNMIRSGCDLDLVREAIIARKGAELVWPFRYVAAARAARQLEPAIDKALCASIASSPPLSGTTVVLVDVSGSMEARLSARSDLKRMDAAAALASVIHGDLRVFTFSGLTLEVPPRRGMAGVDAVIRSQSHGGTFLGAAVETINSTVRHDRLIVITDEQTRDKVPPPVARHAYLINVASTRNGVGYKSWTHIDGFSEAVIRFIREREASLS